MIALLTACVWISDREAEERLDRDDDGFLPIELGGEDCDDGDATIQPDASELCGDGVDNDCDGLTDEGVTTVWYPDEDGDHLGDPDKPYSACSAPDGYTEDNSDCDDTRAEVLGPQACWVDFDGDGYGDEDASSSPNCDPDGPGVASNNSDCDDTRAEVYPEATEICDGHDNDCDGDTDEDAEDASIWYLDYDSDSYGDTAYTTMACHQPSGYVDNDDDCDDIDAEVNPAAEEICGNGVDDDCTSGGCAFSGELLLGDADAIWYGSTSGDSLGHTIATGDLDASGSSEIIVGAPWVGDNEGVIYLLAGPASGLSDIENATLAKRVGAVGSNLGGAIAIGDFSGSGTLGLLLGMKYYDNNAGAVGFLDGPMTGTGTLNAPLLEGDSGSKRGQAVATAELDGDSSDEAVFTSKTTLWALDETTMTAPLLTLSSASNPTVLATGDLSGDGLDEIIVGMPFDDTSGTNSGLVAVLDTPTDGAEVQDAAVTLIQGDARHLTGNALTVTDTDGDGTADLLVGAEGSDAEGTDTGAAYLFLSPFSANLQTKQADATFFGDEADDKTGSALLAVDLTGDQAVDVAIGAKGRDRQGVNNAGVVYLVHGPITPSTLMLASKSNMVLLGDADNDYAGASLGACDLDGDGQLELLVGAYLADVKQSSDGALYLVDRPGE